MKSKIVLIVLGWTLLISILHFDRNVGWGELTDEVRVLLGQQRRSLIVGFLPVT